MLTSSEGDITSRSTVLHGCRENTIALRFGITIIDNILSMMRHVTNIPIRRESVMKLAVFIMMISALISGAKTEEVLTAMKPSNPVWLEFFHYRKLFKNPISERWGKQICLN